MTPASGGTPEGRSAPNTSAGFDPSLAVIALGGNATFPPDIKGTAEEQFAIVGESVRGIVDVVRKGQRCVLTHGNGPVVGNILIRMARAADVIAPMPMDICVADSQGGIGYIIQQSLYNRLRTEGLDLDVAALLTQVEVAADDPAFADPTKPIGPYYEAQEAERIGSETGWQFVEVQADGPERFRRVVPSPMPVRVLEAPLIERLVAARVIPIAVGGGGVPVVAGAAGYRGVSAVIDKDLASAVLALQLRAGVLLILTGVDRVAIDFRKPTQRYVSELSVADAKRYLEAGEFPPGSMGPKIRAAIHYVEGRGQSAIITSLLCAAEALAGGHGTRIVP